MKKIDFHIHTVATVVDAAFDFDMAKLQEYVEVMQLDGIAITNHNMFDLPQFRQITGNLTITVLPGIEINLGKGHCLVIADKGDLTDFVTKCNKVSDIIKTDADSIDVAKLREIFGDLSRYLVIPHYDKHKPVDKDTLDNLGDDFIVGEVASAKKFIYAQSDADSPTPVLFSDGRAKSDWDFRTRQTYLDISTVDVRSMRLCLTDKSKVSLSTVEGKELIQVTPEGITISTGLTVVLGGRSSGKSHTLDQIEKYVDNVKYIKQFELIEADPTKEADKFNEQLGQKRREDSDKYLKQFRGVVDDVKNISLENDDKKLSDYLASLLQSASEFERQDLYSKTALFTETEFLIEDSEKLKSLIKAVIALLTPGTYVDMVEARLPRESLRLLLLELIEKFREETLVREKREWANSIVRGIRAELGARSAVTPVKEIDMLALARNKQKIARFSEIVKELQKPRTIAKKPVQRFTIEERSVAIRGAQDLKDISRRLTSFSDAFSKYSDPYKFLCAIKAIEEVDPTTYYQFFTKIEYKIINEYQAEVSGGERAEFKLVSKIDGASAFDLLLIDEPESSFDNIFLSTDVNQVIKEIAKNTPVVVVTHNNTIGASIKPDYLIYTDRKIVDNSPEYQLYFGRATDKHLVAIDGTEISNADITLKYLEAGKDLYDERSRLYEMLKN